MSLYTVKCAVMIASGVGDLASYEKSNTQNFPFKLLLINFTQRENLAQTLYKQRVVHLYKNHGIYLQGNGDLMHI